MGIAVSRHVFGCERGYRTLATSGDLSPAEIRQLETFSFGQTDDPDYLASLRKTPAYWCRPLSSGRVAVTRVLPGNPDDKGRNTLLMITAVVSQRDWLRHADADASKLLSVEELWKWPSGKGLQVSMIEPSPHLPRTPSAATRACVLSALGLLEAHDGKSDTSIVATEFEFPPDAFRWLVRVLPADRRATFSYAVRSLSDALPVAVNCLAEGAARGRSGRRIVRWSGDVDYQAAPYTAALAYFWEPGKQPPWEFIANCRSFGQARKTSAVAQVPRPAPANQQPAPTESHRRRPRPRLSWPVVLSVALMSVIGITAFFANQIIQEKREHRARMEQARRQREALIADAESFLHDHSSEPTPMLPAQEHERRSLLSKAESINARLESAVNANRDHGKLAELREDMGAWLDKAQQEDKDHRELSKLLSEFDDFKRNALPALTPTHDYPDADTRSRVEEWRTRLDEQRDRAKRLGEPYPTRLDELLDDIKKWDARLVKMLDQWEQDLGDAQAFFTAEPPNVLSNDVIKQSKKLSSVVGSLMKRTEHAAGDPLSDRAGKLRVDVQKCAARATKWRERIEKLQGDYRQYFDKAEEKLRPGDVEIGPLDLDDVKLHWKAAREAKEFLDKALALWPDNADARERQEAVEDWVSSAAELAFDEFRDSVEAAGEVDQGIDTVPSARVCRLVAEALTIFSEYANAIRHHDRAEADKLKLEAMRLEEKHRCSRGDKDDDASDGADGASGNDGPDQGTRAQHSGHGIRKIAPP